MSHFSEVKTRIRDKRLLQKALTNLGYVVEEATEGVPVRGFFGDTVQGDFKISTGTAYDIGFRRNEAGDYELLGDWELMPKVADIQQEDFLKKVKREYARTAIVDMAAERGLEVETHEENGTFEMVVTQW